jgi:hypothetical protein
VPPPAASAAAAAAARARALGGGRVTLLGLLRALLVDAAALPTHLSMRTDASAAPPGSSNTSSAAAQAGKPAQ